MINSSFQSSGEEPFQFDEVKSGAFDGFELPPEQDPGYIQPENEEDHLQTTPLTQQIPAPNQSPSAKKRVSGRPSDQASKKFKSAEETHVCEWDGCDAHFDSLTQLGEHLSSHIKQQKSLNRSSKKSGYICKWKGCSRKVPFKGCYNLEHHLRYQHTGEKPFKCNWCSSRFAQRSDMGEHLRSIHNEILDNNEVKKKREPPCNIAYSSFQEQSSLPSEPEKVRYAVVSRAQPVPILPAPTYPPVDLATIRGYPLMNTHLAYSTIPPFRCGKFFTDTSPLETDPVTIDQQLFPNSASDFPPFAGMRSHFDPSPVQPFATIPNCYLQSNYNFNFFTYPARVIPTVEADYYLNSLGTFSWVPSDSDPTESSKKD